MKTVLITGGFGYVGSRLTPLLLDKRYKVKVLDLCLYGEYGYEALNEKQKANLTFLNKDLRDPAASAEAVKGVDTIIHLAAISNDPTGELNETLTRQVNFDAVGMLIANAKKAGVKRFINASSSSVFGIKKEADVSEELEPEPLTFYSKYKMLSEWIVKAAASQDFCTVNIRPATICGYSPRQRLDLTVNKLTADAIIKRKITVHGGQQRRPNVGMNDVITLYAKLIETPSELINGQTFNFGFENLTVLDIAKLVQKQLSDLDPSIDVTSTTDNRDYHISSKKILKVLDYKPASSIANEINELKKSISAGQVKDIDAPQFYNMKSMKLDLFPAAYKYLAQ